MGTNCVALSKKIWIKAVFAASRRSILSNAASLNRKASLVQKSSLAFPSDSRPFIHSIIFDRIFREASMTDKISFLSPESNWMA